MTKPETAYQTAIRMNTKRFGKCKCSKPKKLDARSTICATCDRVIQPN